MGKKIKIKRIKPSVKYSGSLVQQNHGEQLGHGYLRWDVPTRTSTYVEVHNDYGYYTVDIEGGVLPDLTDVPNKARLRLRVSNTDGSEIKTILTDIRRRYGIEEVVVNRTDKLFETIRSNDGKINIGDVTDADYQYSLIEAYLKRNYVIGDELLVDIKKLNEKLNAKLPISDISRNIFWKIKTFEFDNMFSYGSNNVVDFTKLDGIVGLFSPNATGKSSLFDALCFCLFDTSSRTFKADRILNNKETSFRCKVNFEINGEDYFIERIANKQKRGNVPCPVRFWKIEDGEEIDLNGEQRSSTNTNIRKYIGTYDDFALTAISVQNNNTTFIDKGQTDRKELLAQFMGLGIFDELYTSGNEEVNKIEAVLKSFAENDHDEELVKIEDELVDLEAEYSTLITVRTRLKDDESILNGEVAKLNKNLKIIDPNIIDINTLQSDKSNLEDALVNFNDELDNLVDNSRFNNQQMRDLEEKKSEFEKDDILSEHEQLQQYISDRDEVKSLIHDLHVKVKQKMELVSGMRNWKWNPECDACFSNKSLALKAREAQKELIEDRKLADKYVVHRDTVEELIARMSNISILKNEYDEVIWEIQGRLSKEEKISDAINLKKVQLENFAHKLEDVNGRIYKYHTNEQDILTNKKLNEEISTYLSQINVVQTKLDDIDNDIRKSHGAIEVLNSKRDHILNTLKKISELEDKYGAYKYYLESVKRDGVPYELIQKTLPVVETAVNDILSQIVDFGILFEMDGKNVNLIIVYDEENSWPLELASGMEKFISSLAIRVGLVNVCNLPRINGLFVDEGFGALDSDNLSSMGMLFQYLKTQFSYVVIVSHLETMRDAVDDIMEIDSVNGYANIRHV